MRFYEGDYAYEIERVLDPATQVVAKWRWNVYRVRPGDELLQSGDTLTQEAAEEAGKQALASVLREERQPGQATGKDQAA